ncbi:MAG: AAA family ATPase [Leptolyngbyaceae cyanobacterium MO_188.B28]|nr:AAA family ATPase [Leptolyngbyaceae cyanobacterium MO_188.B28]
MDRVPQELLSTDPESSDSIPEVLPGLSLSQAQWVALQQLEQFAHGGEKLYLLTGYAGTGKTTLLQALITRLREQGDKRDIVLTAFSNKATKVLNLMASRWGLEVDCMTCCKLLGLRPVIDEQTGTQVFRPERHQDSQIDRYDLVVVDECSMINEEMWGLLVQAVSSLYGRTQLLFVGDPAQLPPVGERESPCFRQIFHRSDLTEVVRYGGAIALLAEDIRRNLERPHFPRFQNDVNPDLTTGSFVTRRQPWEKLLIRAFTSQAYREDPDQVRALAYTNRRVNQLNQMIRAAIYGAAAPRFVRGERLMANTPCVEADAILLQTSAECEVLDVAEGQAGPWAVWQLDVETEEKQYRTLRVLHEKSRTDFQLRLQGFADEKRWLEFWELKELFHDVSYAYSLTIHKSQGSTFQDVFVDLPNMMVNRNVVERNQLCYVAFTRAANRLFLRQ